MPVQMGTLEVLNEIYNYSDYIVSSEQFVPSYGYPYEDILQSWYQNLEPDSIAKQISYLYTESYYPGGSQNFFGGIQAVVTSSTLKTDQMDSLLTEIKRFTTQWKTSSRDSIFIRAKKSCQALDPTGAQIDLREYAYFLHESDNDLLNVFSAEANFQTR